MNFKHANRRMAASFPVLSDHEQYAIVFALKESIDNKVKQLLALYNSGLERSHTLYTMLGNGLIEIHDTAVVLDKICPDTIGIPTMEFRLCNNELSDQELQRMVREFSEPELNLSEGFVTQLWEDGAITYCKSGVDPQYSTVHVMHKGLPGLWRLRATWDELADDGRGFIYCTSDNAMAVRIKMINALMDML